MCTFTGGGRHGSGEPCGPDGRVLLSFPCYPSGPDDEALRCWTDVIERVARDQRERTRGRRVEHGHILWRHDPGPFDAVHLLLSQSLELDGVTRRDVFQASEKPVAVAGDTRVAIRPRQWRTVDVTDGAVERGVIGARQDCHFQANLRDAQDREGGRRGFAQCPPPGADTFRVPEAQIWCLGLLERDRLEDRKPLEFPPSPHCTVDGQRTVRNQAHYAGRPRDAFRENAETAHRYPSDGLSRLHSETWTSSQHSPAMRHGNSAAAASRPRRSRARAGGPVLFLFSSAVSKRGPCLLRADGANPVRFAPDK